MQSEKLNDPEGIVDTSYSVLGLQWLWHGDGNHKLIRYDSASVPTYMHIIIFICRWNLVIHGGIDGHSSI